MTSFSFLFRRKEKQKEAKRKEKPDKNNNNKIPTETDNFIIFVGLFFSLCFFLLFFSPEKKRERREGTPCPGGAAFSPQNTLPYL